MLSGFFRCRQPPNLQAPKEVRSSVSYREPYDGEPKPRRCPASRRPESTRRFDCAPGSTLPSTSEAAEIVAADTGSSQEQDPAIAAKTAVDSKIESFVTRPRLTVAQRSRTI